MEARPSEPVVADADPTEPPPPVTATARASPERALPNWSFTATTRGCGIWSPAAPVCASPEIFSKDEAAAARAVTEAAADFPDALAVRVWEPAAVPSVHDADRSPDASVAPLDGVTAPAVAENVTA